jgi:hypothetical protein
MIGKEAKRTRSLIFASTGNATTSTRDVVPIAPFSGGYAVCALFIVGCYSAGSGSLRMRETMIALKWES